MMNNIKPDIHSAMLEIERLQARIEELERYCKGILAGEHDWDNKVLHKLLREKE